MEEIAKNQKKKKTDHIDGVALALQAQHSAVGYDRYGWRVAVAPKIPTRRATATAHRPETVVVARAFFSLLPPGGRNSRERESGMHLSINPYPCMLVIFNIGTYANGKKNQTYRQYIY